MNRITLLSILFILLSKTLPAQEKVNWSVVDNWIQQSETVQLSDSVTYLIRQESKLKNIPDKVMNKNIIYFRMLFNPAFSTEQKIRISDYVLEVFSGFENQFPTELVKQTKAYLQKP